MKKIVLLFIFSFVGIQFSAQTETITHQQIVNGNEENIATIGNSDQRVVYDNNVLTDNPNFKTTSGQFATSDYNLLPGIDKLTVQLYTNANYNNGGPVHDGFVILFAEGNDNGLTPQDAIKPMNFYENLGINHEGTLLSFESRAIPLAGEVFALFSSGYQHTEYVLELIVDGLEDSPFYLNDHFTGGSTLFETGESSYSFSIDTNNPLSIATNRFSIHVGGSRSVDYIYENGGWTPGNPSGNATDLEDILIVNGTAALSANTNVNNLIIDVGATLKIHNVLNLKGNLSNHGKLVFMSSAAGNGELAEISPTSVITGNATVQRYFKDRRSYRMVSSAVTTNSSIHTNWQEGATNETPNPNPGFGTHITGSKTGQNGFDVTATGNASMYTVNVATQQFEVIDNTDVDTLTAGKPYLMFVRGDRSIDLTNNEAFGTTTVLRATGSLFTGTHTQSFPAGNGEEENFVMFGNPYQSAVDIKAVFANAGSANLNPNHYYVYDPTLAEYGSYVTIDLSLENDGTNSAGSVANKYLQPGQAAQVEVFGASTVVFKEGNKSPGHFTNSNRNPISESDMLTVQLYTTENFDNGGPVHDSFAILFGEGNDNGLTSEDAVKPMNFYENLGIDHNGTYLSLERRAFPEGGEIFSLFTNGYQHTNYVLKMEMNGLDGVEVYLDDHFTGESTLLEQGMINYGFAIDPTIPESSASDRFVLRVGERLNVNDHGSSLLGLELYPNPMRDQLTLANPKNIQLINASIFDLTGRLIKKFDLKKTTLGLTLNVSSFSSGTYMVLITGEDGQISKLMVKE